MRNTIYTAIFFLAIIFPSNAQELLKEISKAFDNGQPMFIDYLETENLKKVKTEIFNETGKLIFSIKFNPDTGLPDGEFYDLINKGSFKEGVLNCLNCMLVEANSPSVYTYNHNKQNTKITYGDVINGRLVGEVKTYAHYEETYNKVDWNSTRRYVAAGAGLGFRDVKTYTTGKFTKTLVDTKTYNENGVLDGEIFIGNKNGWHARLNVDNGIVKSYVSYDKNGIVIDSLFNENKIWKINYKFVKNSGFIVFKAPEDFKAPSEWDERHNDYNYFYIPLFRDEKLKEYYDNHIPEEWKKGKTYKEYLGRTNSNGIIAIGGKQIYTWEEFASKNIYYRKKTINTGAVPSELDNNGLYTIFREDNFGHILSTNIPSRNGYGNFKNHRKTNLLVIVYNYLKNEGYKSILDINELEKYISENKDFHTFQVISFSYHNTLKPFLEIFKSNKTFSKHIKGDASSLPWRKEDGYKYLSLRDFFDYIITIEDYLRACKEIIENSRTNVREVWVWNHKTNNYDKANFEELIQLAEQKEKELQEKEDQKTKQMEAKQEEFLKKHPLSIKSLLEYSEDLDDFKNKFIKEFKDEIKDFKDIENRLNKLYSDYLKTLRIPLESDNKNLEFENKKTTKNLELEFFKDLKLELTSEKSSEKYSSYISGIVKQYNKSYNLKIQDLEVYISQKNKNKEYYRYIFSNIEDLESLKKAFNQYAQPIYIDLDNKAPSIYYKK